VANWDHSRFVFGVVMILYCCGCVEEVQARLTNGYEIYPHRKDLFNIPFWRCDSCGNFVGCHYKTKNRTAPLGCIPTKELKKARMHIHEILDPLWKSGKFKRNALYKKLTVEFGWSYHTAKIRTVEEARDIYRFILNLSKQ
jgi:hypothetical protein